MQSIRPLAPLLTAAGILLAGNGVQGMLIAVRGAAEGFSPGLIGFIATAYFGGFLFGCLAITRILQNVGHIRAFSALAALASAAALMLAMAPNPVAWMAVRFISGFCFSGLFTTMESWLNSGVTNEARGRVLSLYRIIDIGAVTGAQYLIPAFGAAYGLTRAATAGIPTLYFPRKPFSDAGHSREAYDAALAAETAAGLEVIRSGETQRGAARFAAGHGRHGSFEDL